jgi:hypothetical protein
MMKKILSSKLSALGLALLLVISTLGSAIVPAAPAYAEAQSSTEQEGSSVTQATYGAEAFAAAQGAVDVTGATYAVAEYILSNGVKSEWQAIGLAQAGYNVPSSYRQSLETKVRSAAGSFTSVTDYARIALAVKAIGADPLNFAGSDTSPGYNLIEKIYNSDKISGQTLNHPVYALLALDSGNYTIPGDAKWTRDKLLTEILSKQNSDGGFALTQGASDPDMTAITLTALAAHKDNTDANTAGERAVAWLASTQNSNGGYGDSSESVSQAIIGLTSFGIDPTSEDFTKNGVELVGKLLSFYVAGEGFSHNQGGASNALATEQGLQALVAYNLFSKGSNGKLYDFSKPPVQNPLVYVPLVIEGPNGTLAQGNIYASNVLEALEKLAVDKGLPISKTSSNYVTKIGDISAGSFGKLDGWMYGVSRNGQWVTIDVGMDGFKLRESDRVLIYYSGSDTQLVDSVVLSKETPKEAEAFTVTVTQKTWVWNGTGSDPVVSKAANVQVQIGDHKATTDSKGEAVFSGDVPAGNYTLTVTGYRVGDVPTIARFTQPLKVAPKNVTTQLSVEGPQGPIGEVTLKASNTLDALKQFTADHNIPLDITESSFGSYVSGINGVSAGTFGGWWSFVVSRNGQWIDPGVGMEAFELQESDHVLVYYAGVTTQVVDSLKVSASQPQPGQAFTVTVTQKKWVWNNTTFTSDPVTSPAAGVRVSVGGITQTTDNQGVASFADGLSANTYTITVTGYITDSTPSVARYTQSLVVATPSAKASATISVVGDSSKGTILSSTTVPLNEGETAYSLLVRQLGSKVAARGGSGSTYVYSIDGLAEYDRGVGSGWMYLINGTIPSVSADSYILKNGDSVDWRYTVDLGKDLGGPVVTSPPASGGTTVTITPENTLPLTQVGQTTTVTNVNSKMTAAEAAELQKALAANTVSITQEVTPGTEATLKDNAGEVQLQIPAGAVSSAVTISVKEIKSDRTELVSGLYEFTPDGTKFVKPVDLSIKVPITTAYPANLVVAWLNKTTNQWIPVPTMVDVKNGIITGKISHFTDYAVIDRSLWEPQQEQLKKDIAGTAKFITTAGAISDWQAIGLARSGSTLPGAYLSGLKDQLAENKGEFRKVTDYARIALAAGAAGADPLTIGGYNLIEKIYNNANMTVQGSNGPIFALIALDSGAYSVPATAQWTREKLVDWLLKQQSKDGGFPLTAGGSSDIDITAMAVTALSSYKAQAEVNMAIDKALNWLSLQQLENGGYKLGGVENSESVSQVIIALSAVGTGPNDPRFVKAKGGLLSNLTVFRQADGGYAHAVADKTSNGMATEQALLALTAYDRLLNGKDKLYSFSAAQVTPTPAPSVTFADEGQISAWALKSVHTAYDNKLMQGVSADSLIFAPKANITRAQFAALLLRLTNNKPSDVSAAPVFSDVKGDAWYYGDVLKAKELGIIDGVCKTAFNPNGTITRQDMAVMIARAFKLEAPANQPSFKDQTKIGSYALTAVQSVSELGYMTGFNGSFDPSAPVTREMAAVVAVRLP